MICCLLIIKLIHENKYNLIIAENVNLCINKMIEKNTYYYNDIIFFIKIK